MGITDIDYPSRYMIAVPSMTMNRPQVRIKTIVSSSEERGKTYMLPPILPLLIMNKLNEKLTKMQGYPTTSRNVPANCAAGIAPVGEEFD